LDWSEICDGKVDCLDGGEDEKHCHELYINRCEENEYQCRNGMCVNEDFLRDEFRKLISPECMDASDEIGARDPDDDDTCLNDPTFRCEDFICRTPWHFPCGDGNCLKYYFPRNNLQCNNQRDQAFNFLVDWHNSEDTEFPRCFKTLICASILISSNNFDQYCTNLCLNKEECKRQTLDECPSSFIAPTFPMWGGHVRLGYFTNQTINSVKEARPEFICYNEYLCPFLIPTFTVNNYTCLRIDELKWSSLDDFYKVFISCYNPYQIENKIGCAEPTMIRCLETNKCIHAHKINDGIPDCFGDFDELFSAGSCILND
ncbi:unnamed protein product, partial [Adineta ricciae]